MLYTTNANTHIFSTHFPGKPGLASVQLPPWCWVSSHPYPEHPHRTGQNSSYSNGCLGGVLVRRWTHDWKVGFDSRYQVN